MNVRSIFSGNSEFTLQLIYGVQLRRSRWSNAAAALQHALDVNSDVFSATEVGRVFSTLQHPSSVLHTDTVTLKCSELFCLDLNIRFYKLMSSCKYTKLIY